MNIIQQFNGYFGCEAKADSDGYCHYLLETMDGHLHVDTTQKRDWRAMDLTNKLILSCNHLNEFNLVWTFGDEYFDFHDTRVSTIEKRTHKFSDAVMDAFEEEFIEIKFDDLVGKTLKIQTKPSLSVTLATDYAGSDEEQQERWENESSDLTAVLKEKSIDSIHRSSESVTIIFADGSRFFIDLTHSGLELTLAGE